MFLRFQPHHGEQEAEQFELMTPRQRREVGGTFGDERYCLLRPAVATSLLGY